MAITKSNVDALREKLEATKKTLDAKIEEAESYRRDNLKEEREQIELKLIELEGGAEFNDSMMAVNRASAASYAAHEKAEIARLTLLEEQLKLEQERRVAMDRQTRALEVQAISSERTAKAFERIADSVTKAIEKAIKNDERRR